MKPLGMHCIALSHNNMVATFENWTAKEVKSGATPVPPLPCWKIYPELCASAFRAASRRSDGYARARNACGRIGGVTHGEAVPLLSTGYSARGRHTAEALHGEAEHRIVTTDLLFHAMPDPVYAELSIDGLNTLLDEAPTF